MIADAIKEVKDVEVDRRRIKISGAIKTVGEHEVEIDLYRDIKATATISVVDIEAKPVVEEVAEEEAEVVEAAAESEETADAE